MSQDSSPASNGSDTQAAEKPQRLILLGLLIIALSVMGWFALHWYVVRTELAQTATEIQALRLELRDTRQRLDAQLVINRRQAQMLKEATEGSAASAKP